ncbi:MAG: hypothetical protein GVY16_04605 [Planctomycetes bacterium]|nr:hypothetical protein [Planctomycetota bacterium]
MPILAAMNDYLRLWQLPLFGVFLFGWLVGGGYLFHHTLSMRVKTRKGVPFGRGVLISLLSGMAGALAGAVLYKVGAVTMPPAPPAPGEPPVPISILGVILGIIGYAVVAWLVVFAMMKLSAGQVLSASLRPIGATIGLAIAIGLGCAIPAARQVKRERAQFELMRQNMEHMKALYRWIYRRAEGEPVATLAQLKTYPGFDETLLKNPARPDMDIGYFYHPSPSTRLQPDPTPGLLMTDYANTYAGMDERIVLYNNGEIKQLNDAAFQIELNDPVNAEFAEAYKAAGKP